MNLSIFLSRVLIGVCRRLFPRNLTYSSNCTGSRFTRTMVGVLGPFCRVALNGKKNLPPETSTACRRHQALLPILRRSRRQKTRVRRRQRVKNVSLARTALAETILWKSWYEYGVTSNFVCGGHFAASLAPDIMPLNTIILDIMTKDIMPLNIMPPSYYSDKSARWRQRCNFYMEQRWQHVQGIFRRQILDILSK